MREMALEARLLKAMRGRRAIFPLLAGLATRVRGTRAAIRLRRERKTAMRRCWKRMMSGTTRRMRERERTTMTLP